MGIRFYNLNGFFVKKLAHGVNLLIEGLVQRIGVQEALRACVKLSDILPEIGLNLIELLLNYLQ